MSSTMPTVFVLLLFHSFSLTNLTRGNDFTALLRDDYWILGGPSYDTHKGTFFNKSGNVNSLREQILHVTTRNTLLCLKVVFIHVIHIYTSAISNYFFHLTDTVVQEYFEVQKFSNGPSGLHNYVNFDSLLPCVLCNNYLFLPHSHIATNLLFSHSAFCLETFLPWIT
jgi:hypothetical protein